MCATSPHPDTEAQARGCDEPSSPSSASTTGRWRRIIEVWNKVDRLDRGERERLAAIAARRPADERPVLVSALTGEGIAALLARIEGRSPSERPVYRVILDAADGAALNWLYE